MNLRFSSALIHRRDLPWIYSGLVSTEEPAAAGSELRSVRRKTQPDPPIGDKRVRECEWEPCKSLKVPEAWTSGVYVGKLTEQRGGLQSYVIFIVRDERPADLIFQCSDTTWQAYNRWPSQFSLYDDGKEEWFWGPGVVVSFNRPYGKYCQIVDAPLSTGSGEWFLWEFPFAYWLESHGTTSPTFRISIRTAILPACAAREASSRSGTTSITPWRCFVICKVRLTRA